MRNFIRITVSGLLFILVVIFAIANREYVVIKLTPIPWQFELPLFLFGMFMLTLGYIWGSSIAITQRYRVKRDAKKQLERNVAMQEEIASLRAERQTPKPRALSSDASRPVGPVQPAA